MCEEGTNCSSIFINCTLDEESDMILMIINWTVQVFSPFFYILHIFFQYFCSVRNKDTTNIVWSGNNESFFGLSSVEWV